MGFNWDYIYGDLLGFNQHTWILMGHTYILCGHVTRCYGNHGPFVDDLLIKRGGSA